MDSDAVLWLHIGAGVVAWVIGAIALWLSVSGRRPRDGLSAFHWSVLAVAVTAAALVAFRPAELWWLWLLAFLSYGLALLGHFAPRKESSGWLRLGIHGQGGACIALVTATFVVSVDGLVQIAAWALPTLVGVPLLEVWYRRAVAARPNSGPTTVTDLNVRPLSADDSRAAGALLAASHRDYPAFRLEFPDPNIRRRVLLPFQTAAVRDTIRHGRALGAFLGDSLAGVALWQPPWRFPHSTWRKTRMTPALVRAAIAAPRAFPRFAGSGSALACAVPTQPFWYLQALGVHPSAQRRGVGTALLAEGLALADADNLRCHLHTSDPANVEYYRRWGFELTQPAFVAGPKGPTYYGMTRGAVGRP